MKFVEDMLTLVREDFRNDLLVFNLADLQEVSFEMLHANQLNNLGISAE